MLLNDHSSFGVRVHRWSAYETRQVWDVGIRHHYSHAVWRRRAAVWKGDRGRYGAAVVQQGRREAVDRRLCAAGISSAMHDGIADTFVGRIGQYRVGIHQPAKL